MKVIIRVGLRLRLTEEFKRRLFRYSRTYEISGSLNLNWNPIYLQKSNYPNFASELETFKRNLIEQIKSKKSVGYLKFGDGDYYFLKGLPVGSASPGKRALSHELTPDELFRFQKNALEVDHYLCEIDSENRKLFREIFKAEDPIPAEFVYGLTANHWLTQLPCKIGIIGADKKVNVIRQLMQFVEYQDYLGLREFSDYVEVPQKFACDDLSTRIIELQKQIQNSQADLFLVGVGHLKSGIMAELTKMRNVVFLDIGSGIDALAGLIDSQRPYFGSWLNYRTKDESIYSEIDLLQYKHGRTKFLN
jgi:hypothetical protein